MYSASSYKYLKRVFKEEKFDFREKIIENCEQF